VSTETVCLPAESLTVADTPWLCPHGTRWVLHRLPYRTVMDNVWYRDIWAVLGPQLCTEAYR
jgi:hypothetical protein